MFLESQPRVHTSEPTLDVFARQMDGRWSNQRVRPRLDTTRRVAGFVLCDLTAGSPQGKVAAESEAKDKKDAKDKAVAETKAAEKAATDSKSGLDFDAAAKAEALAEVTCLQTRPAARDQPGRHRMRPHPQRILPALEEPHGPHRVKDARHAPL